MPNPMTVSEAARDISARTGHVVSPQSIAGLFYRRRLNDALCPIAGRVRLIPPNYVATIEAVLREHGYLPPADAAQESPHAS